MALDENRLAVKDYTIIIIIPMLADYRLPFGIVTSNSLSEDVIIFLKAIKDILRVK